MYTCSLLQGFIHSRMDTIASRYDGQVQYELVSH